MYATAYIVFTVAIAALCYITCVVPFTFFEKRIWKYFSGTQDDSTNEAIKYKRKESKPTIIDIGPPIAKSKFIENLKSRMDQHMETKSFQT